MPARAKAVEVSFPVAGMTCQACAHSIERALRSVPGVDVAEVNYGSRTARVEYDTDGASAERLADAVRRAGYSVPEGIGEASDLASDVAFGEAAERKELRRLTLETIAAVVLGASTIVLSMSGAPRALVLACATLVQLGAGGRVLLLGWRALRRLAPDMNSLIALGSTAAWLAGTGAALGVDALGEPGPHLHAAVMTLAFTLIGRLLEGRARASAGDAVRTLLDLTPPTARVLRRGAEEQVSLDEVRLGNLVLVRPGERFPVDGSILDGRSTIDESLLTGESVGIERGPGDPVHAGTINGAGALSVKATGIGLDTAVGRIATAVRNAQSSRARAQRTADRISAVFVPFVLALAALTFGGWLASGSSLDDALGRLVAVLVVACPCALGLATPTAIVAASARAAREGCLFKNAEALERLARVDVIALDKTGTLTRGATRLAGVVVAEGVELGEDELLALAAAVERSSEQPIARAVVAAARERSADVGHARDVEAEPGRGVRGTVGGRSVWLGSARAAGERDDVDPTSIEALVRAVEERAPAGTPVCMLVDGELVAALAIVDPLRDESAEATATLERMGIEVQILSGDHPRVVAAIADELGIAVRHGDMRPEEKAEHLRALRAKGRRVAMAGDGINDAVALSVADVGIAFGGGADVAIEAADGALLADDPSRLPRLVALARRTVSTIHTNLVWAFAYNVVALPLAAGVLVPWTNWALPPQVGAATMAGSSLFVVLNSLRLRWSNLD